MWSVARYDLGLSESEFWELTFIEFDALVQRMKASEERFMFGFQFLATVTARLHGNKEVDFTKPAKGGAPAGERVSDWKDQKTFVVALNEIFGGKDLRK